MPWKGRIYMIKKRLKGMTTVIVAVALVMSLVGCGGRNKEEGDESADGRKKVEIAYWNSGLGTDFLEAMIKAFNEKQDDYYVTYRATASSSALMAGFGEKDTDTTDLYLNIKDYDTSKLEPLDDVLDSVVSGENVALKEKFIANYLDYEKAGDGHYYTLTYGGGTLGIVYNKELFKKAGITATPRTTNELATVCDTLLEAGITPWTHYSGGGTGGGYWTYLLTFWQEQYDGEEYFLNNFYGCTDLNGNSPSKDVFTAKDGRYQAMKATEKFITPDYVYNGSNSQDHITMQTLFLNKDIGMVVNGAWMVNEMKDTDGDKDKFAVMKTPVISAITDKLSTVKSDIELRELISAVDAVTDGKAEISEYQTEDQYLVKGKTISKEDWEYVYNARNMVPFQNPAQSLFIPSYSDNIAGAKEFLKFFYSDEGYQIFTSISHMALPLRLSAGEIDTSGWNDFERTMFDMATYAEKYSSDAISSKHAIFIGGGATPYASYPFITHFCSNNSNDRVSADEAWDAIMKKVDSQYDSWLANIE